MEQRRQQQALPRRWVGILIGILLLLTLIIPWGIYGGMWQWSWGIFRGKNSLSEILVVVSWIIGLVVPVAAILTAGAGRATIYGLAGVTGITLFLARTHAGAAPWHSLLVIPARQDWPELLGIAIVALFLVVTLVAGSDRTAHLRNVRRVVAVLLAGVLILSAFGEVRGYLRLSRGDYFTRLGVGVSILSAWTALMGCWMAYDEASSPKRIATARQLVLWALALKLLWSIVNPAIAGRSFGGALAPLNNAILLIGLSTLIIEGASGWMAFSLSGRRPEEMAPPPAVSRWRTRSVLAGACAAVIVAAVAAGASRTGTEKRLELSSLPPARGADWPTWCGAFDRNMVSPERGLPIEFDEVTASRTSDLNNVKWVVRLTDRTLGSPIVGQGKVLIGGTGQNGTGILWCFEESSGKLLWRMNSPNIHKLYNEAFGVCATPSVEQDRIYLVNHLADVLCLSTQGMTGPNRGPFTDEANYFAQDRRITRSEMGPDGNRIVEWTSGKPATLSPIDADILWQFNMIRGVNCYPFNAISSGNVIHGDHLFVATCSVFTTFQEGGTLGIPRWKAENHRDSYFSPSIIALDKHTGKLLATDATGSFEKTFHGAHSSPALGKVNGSDLLVYGGGNGTCYAFDPNFTAGTDGRPAQLRLVWKYDCTDAAGDSSGFRAEQPVKSEIIATPVIYKNRVYIATGNDLANSGLRARPARLFCLDATMTGDVTRRALIWSFDQLRSSPSTVAIADGLLYTADAAGMIYCLDAETGQLQWTHSTQPVWASPLAVDGKVYVPVHNGGLLVFAQARQKKLLAHLMGSKDLVSAPAAANGVLYIASQRHLYALKVGSRGGLIAHDD